MVKTIWIKLALVLASAVFSVGAFAADPTLHQVYQAAEAGNYREAQNMTDQVLRDHPNSAKAHSQAELSTAERLAPELLFAKPAAVQALKARIATSLTPIRRNPSVRQATTPQALVQTIGAKRRGRESPK